MTRRLGERPGGEDGGAASKELSATPAMAMLGDRPGGEDGGAASKELLETPAMSELSQLATRSTGQLHQDAGPAGRGVK